MKSAIVAVSLLLATLTAGVAVMVYAAVHADLVASGLAVVF